MIGAWADNLDNLADLCGSVHSSASRANIQSRESLVRDTMVVKTFRQMNNVSKEEFCEHMVRLGRLSHSNLLSLVAFYYRKEEKLLVSDFVPNGSLASHLHGTISPFRHSLVLNFFITITRSHYSMTDMYMGKLNLKCNCLA